MRCAYAPKIEARFFGGKTDRAGLERHLAGCAQCQALDAKLALLERVTAMGPDGVDRPSPAEVERIAQGLFSEAPRPSLLRRWWWSGVLAASVATAGVILFPKQAEVTSRGETVGASFSVYVIHGDGRVAPLAQGVSPGARLKLRLSGQGEASVRVVLGEQTLIWRGTLDAATTLPGTLEVPSLGQQPLQLQIFLDGRMVEEHRLHGVPP